MGKLNASTQQQQQANSIRKKKVKGPQPKKKSVQAADKSVRTKIANGELVKVLNYLISKAINNI